MDLWLIYPYYFNLRSQENASTRIFCRNSIEIQTLHLPDVCMKGVSQTQDMLPSDYNPMGGRDEVLGLWTT